MAVYQTVNVFKKGQANDLCAKSTSYLLQYTECDVWVRELIFATAQAQRLSAQECAKTCMLHAL